MWRADGSVGSGCGCGSGALAIDAHRVHFRIESNFFLAVRDREGRTTVRLRHGRAPDEWRQHGERGIVDAVIDTRGSLTSQEVLPLIHAGFILWSLLTRS